MRILMIADHLPYPPSSGASIRNYNLAKRISEEHDLWMATLVDNETEASYTPDLLKFCKGVETVELKPSNALDHPIEAIQFLVSGRPIELRHFQSKELIEKIRILRSKIDFDIVDIENSHMSLYWEALQPLGKSKTVVTFHDVIFSKYDRISKLEPKMSRKLRALFYSTMMRRWEPYYTERFSRCIAVSDSDRRLLLNSNPSLKINVVPNGIDTKQYRPLPDSEGAPALIFVGNMDYRPNIDAILYFCRDIFPKIKVKIPEAILWITGINPAREIRELTSDNIHVTGSVEDVRPYYQRSTICIVPLRAGGGTRLKILEAMALGRPVVTTSIGCEGLDVVDGIHLLVADTPEQFAEKTLLLLKDHNLRQRIGEAARKLVVDHYDWDVLARQLLQTYLEVIA